MAVVHAVGPFTITGGSSAAISPALTWSDAGSHTPQVLLLYYHTGAVGTVTGDQIVGAGMTDGTRHFTTCYMNDDAVVATNAGQYLSNAAVLVETDVPETKSGQIDFTSFGTA